MPATFIGDRVFVDAQFPGHRQLRFYTDSGGGGLSIITPAGVKKLGIAAKAPRDPKLLAELGPAASVVVFPRLSSTSRLPQPERKKPALVMQLSQPGWQVESEGQLGNGWLGGHIWTWDYPAKKLLLQPENWQPQAAEKIVPLGFKTTDSGARANNFPRIKVTIDGRMLPMLLDTGAMTVLTPEAEAVVGAGSAARATSMVVSGVFRDWHARHPDWRFISQGQIATKSDMIEVPEVQIAGSVVGPVWFTERPDANFHDMMSSMMDAQVEGAIGGNVLSAFRMTIDYPGARALFSCEIACRAIVPRPSP